MLRALRLRKEGDLEFPTEPGARWYRTGTDTACEKPANQQYFLLDPQRVHNAGDGFRGDIWAAQCEALS